MHQLLNNTTVNTDSHKVFCTALDKNVYCVWFMEFKSPVFMLVCNTGILQPYILKKEIKCSSLTGNLVCPTGKPVMLPDVITILQQWVSLPESSS